MRFARLAFLILLPVQAASASDPEMDWPQFLGPDRNGIVRDKNLNLDWKTRAPATLWKVPIGNGFSSMIIVENRIYTQV